VCTDEGDLSPAISFIIKTTGRKENQFGSISSLSKYVRDRDKDRSRF